MMNHEIYDTITHDMKFHIILISMLGLGTYFKICIRYISKYDTIQINNRQIQPSKYILLSKVV